MSIRQFWYDIKVVLSVGIQLLSTVWWLNALLVLQQGRGSEKEVWYYWQRQVRHGWPRGSKGINPGCLPWTATNTSIYGRLVPRGRRRQQRKTRLQWICWVLCTPSSKVLCVVWQITGLWFCDQLPNYAKRCPLRNFLYKQKGIFLKIYNKSNLTKWIDCYIILRNQFIDQHDYDWISNPSPFRSVNNNLCFQYLGAGRVEFVFSRIWHGFFVKILENS